tara:strand:- start:1174 stop:1410 length:237 start_codon:yes stop_codon:yes gene_type:complete
VKSAEIVALTDILVEYWENAFHVKETGNVFSIFVEMEDTNLSTNLWSHIPMRFKHKHVLIYKVPTGYIDSIVRSDNRE